MTEEENRSEDNLLLLCIEHASEIDETPEHFPVDMLRQWKQAQLTEYLEVHRSWPLNDTEVAEVSAASFDPRRLGMASIGAATVVAVARLVGLLVATARQQRRFPREAAREWQQLRIRTNRSMFSYDANGERVTVEPSAIETRPYREALETALGESVSTLEPLLANVSAELHAVAAADQRLEPWCNWVQDRAENVLNAAGRWPGPQPLDDDEVWPEAIEELQRASQALSAAWRGDDAPAPPEPQPSASTPPETEQQRAIREHRELLETAGPWARVKHRPYNAELYERLTDSMNLVINIPEVPSLLQVGLNLTARFASKVARNADDETYHSLITQAAAKQPLSCSVFLLRQLRITAKDSEKDDLANKAMDEMERLLRAESWQSLNSWTENSIHVRALLSMTAEISSSAAVRETVAAAIESETELLPEIILAMASWSEQLDHTTWETTGIKFQLNELPDWFPMEIASAAIRRHLPDLEPADEFASERHQDDFRRLASQLLWIAAGNDNEW
ncbi:hypothetical protein [Streptomyces tauricus]|uniref:hypothetical protein n=1 Tax=Streptomyces tauricus TaxID=68274 RepID=UPI0033B301AB